MFNKKIFYFIIIILFSSCGENRINEEKNAVKIIFYPEKRMFPSDWYYDDVDAITGKLDRAEISRSKRIISKALDKYPKNLLKENLKKVYILGDLNFYGVDYAGTYSDVYIYLANQGLENGYTDRFIEQSFHHEFSSVLYWKYYDFLDEDRWKAVNPDSDTIYFDELGGAGAMIADQASDYFDEKYHKIGFLYQYATSSFENDFNSFAENLFKCEPDFWNIIDRHKKLREKADIIIDFYHSIDTTFTEEYFKQVSIK